ncbi:pseudouridine synthase [Desulfobulbus alkaliphilus]|uniref:pseudouridine synthase n=1 Tax=Desulfobulbus alkaliphilus TaxID=869814 RepID=UPI001966615F|nr:pseudouridine synthase [Desulfobulbus alkaliphilus]MBM9536829.1 rRNA pseudouridine synthase [Desulfobulbus alkaliphilus]
MKERLQKILAKAGIASRRGSEQLIRAGRIRVNDAIVTEMGIKVDPGIDIVTFDGQCINIEEKQTVLVNKPPGYVTTLSDPQGRPVVADLVADIPLRLFPVGRLDLESEGALLMTNDGELADRILHPRYEVKKTYQAEVVGMPSKFQLKRLEQGISIDGVQTRPASIRVLQQGQNRTLIEVVIHEGKKRQVRKMFLAIGHRVLRLKRTAYGCLHLGTLSPGKYRRLSQADIKKIFSEKIPFTIKNIPA